MSSVIHILHLHRDGIRWISFEGRLPKGKILDVGSAKGEAIQCLDEWLPGKSGKDSEIYLYDSRPDYFSFVSVIPAKAGKEHRTIIPLKIRQEIGLGDDSIRWTCRSLGESSGQVKLLVNVAKSEAQEDIAQWKARSGLRSLWVSSDLMAIEALRHENILDEASVLVARRSEDRALMYALDLDGRVVRSEPSPSSQNAVIKKVVAIGMTPAEAASALSVPLSADLSEATDRFLARLRAKLPEGIIDKVKLLDEILLGGLFEVGFNRPEADSLLGEVEYPSALYEFEKRLKLKPLAIVAAACALLFVGSLTFARLQRGKDTERLLDKANILDDLTEIYEEQAAVLSKVKSDRMQLIPFIEAVYKVAPSDSTLQSLDIAENGLMIIAATTKTQEAGTAFFKDLAATKLFDDIQITYLKLDDGKKWVRLQINAKIRGWKK